MSIERDDDDDGPFLTIDGVRIPFQIEAQASYGLPRTAQADDDWPDEADAPWMIRLPVQLQVMLPHEVRYPTAAAPVEPPTLLHTSPNPDLPNLDPRPR